MMSKNQEHPGGWNEESSDEMWIVTLCRGRIIFPTSTRQRGQAIRQLIQDVQSAMPRAKLSDDQKGKLQSDIDGINAAFQARQQGQSVDRDKLMAMIDDIHQVVDSGAFTEDDQKKLDTEFNSMSSH
jgi:hypothetical protein